MFWTSYVKGVPLVNSGCTKGLPFLSRKVYKWVRVCNSERSLDQLSPCSFHCPTLIHQFSLSEIVFIANASSKTHCVFDLHDFLAILQTWTHFEVNCPFSFTTNDVAYMGLSGAFFSSSFDEVIIFLLFHRSGRATCAERGSMFGSFFHSCGSGKFFSLFFIPGRIQRTIWG